jgi:hypothetical protein
VAISSRFGNSPAYVPGFVGFVRLGLDEVSEVVHRRELEGQ